MTEKEMLDRVKQLTTFSENAWEYLEEGDIDKVKDTLEYTINALSRFESRLRIG